MKKLGTIILILTIFILFWGCKGNDGSVYLSLDWVYTPSYLYLDDSNMPGTIYRLEYYSTNAGDYYIEYYHTESGYTRWMYYTLTAEKGKMFFADGANSYFEISLWAYSDPTITSYTQSIANIDVSTEKEKAQSEGYIPSEFIDVSEEKTEIDLSIYEKKILSVYEESIGGYKLEVVSGIYILKE